MLLPDGDTARAVVDELNKAGIGGFNYWYTNMYHFINQWDHLKKMDTASKLPVEILGAPQDYVNLQITQIAGSSGPAYLIWYTLHMD